MKRANWRKIFENRRPHVRCACTKYVNGSLLCCCKCNWLLLLFKICLLKVKHFFSVAIPYRLCYVSCSSMRIKIQMHFALASLFLCLFVHFLHCFFGSRNVQCCTASMAGYYMHGRWDFTDDPHTHKHKHMVNDDATAFWNWKMHLCSRKLHGKNANAKRERKKYSKITIQWVKLRLDVEFRV